MIEKDDESTVFESNPLGNRQRLKPGASFLTRHAVRPAVGEVEEANADGSIVEALVSGDHTISDVALPASSAVMLPALALATPMPSLAIPVMLLPREIHYPAVATPYYPPADATGGFPTLASRRVRWIAVPALALLALMVLGGAMMPAEIEAIAPSGDIAATQEPTSAPRVYERANEPPAPIAIEEEPAKIIVAKPIARSFVAKPRAKRVVGKPRKVVVNTSSALGNLRPRRAW